MTLKQNTAEQTERDIFPIMLLVTNDPMLMKLLTMALTLELACEVITVNSARKAEEAVKRLKPTLLILDEGLINSNTYDLSDRLHQIEGLEQLPTLFLNEVSLLQSQSQRYPTCCMGWSWKIEALYAAVRSLLDASS